MDGKHTIWLSEDVLDRGIHCVHVSMVSMLKDPLSRLDRKGQQDLPLWMASASLSGISMLNS